jgi:RNA polymerase sigma factor (sigma-70 family)
MTNPPLQTESSADPPRFPQVPSEPPVEGEPVSDSGRVYVTQLFNKYRAALQRYLARLVPAEDAAELVQETYFRLLRHGELVQIEAMARAFLFQTAANLARDHRRRRLSRRADQHVQLDDDAEELFEEHLGPDDHLAGEQAFALLEGAIANLPHDTRMVFLMHRFRDMSYPEIAGVMSLSVRTVARKMAEAMERLSAALEVQT